MAHENKSPLFQRTVILVKSIPAGKVATYGQIAKLLSSSGSARYVSYILSSSSGKYNLPWHRVISSTGKISSHTHSNTQARKLKKEGIFIDYNKINLDEHGWKPTKAQIKSLMKGLPKHQA